MSTEAKITSTFQKRINSITKKWHRDQFNVELLKLESRQLHHLVDKLISERRLTIVELRKHVNSRKEAIEILKKKRIIDNESSTNRKNK
jgi:hypothetical protein